MQNNTVENGNTIKIHYKGYLDTGDEFDNSQRRGEAFQFIVGSKSVIPGFSTSVLGMTIGEKRTVKINCNDAYGIRVEEAVRTVDKTDFPADFQFEENSVVTGNQSNGQPFQAVIKEVTEKQVTLDFNHPLAGKDLNFDIELIEITE
jgi:peptidylprolyl isomerase